MRMVKTGDNYSHLLKDLIDSRRGPVRSPVSGDAAHPAQGADQHLRRHKHRSSVNPADAANVGECEGAAPEVLLSEGAFRSKGLQIKNMQY